MAPLFPIKLLQRHPSRALLIDFAFLEDLQQRLRRIRQVVRGEYRAGVFARLTSIWRRFREYRRHFVFNCTGIELLDPLHHDLYIAQRAQPLEQPFAGLLHRLPLTIRIHRHHPIGHGPAAPQRNPQIVNRISAEIGSDMLPLFQHARHPVAQSRGFGSSIQESCIRNACTPRVFY